MVDKDSRYDECFEKLKEIVKEANDNGFGVTFSISPINKK